MALPATHPGADSTSPELGAHDSAYWGRRPGFGALRPGQLQVRPEEPYLVLDLGKFTARCRSCAWKSTPSGGLAEARFAYSRHVCATGPIAGDAELWRDGRLAWPSDGSGRHPQGGHRSPSAGSTLARAEPARRCLNTGRTGVKSTSW
jgi:hypothetical protein